LVNLVFLEEYIKWIGTFRDSAYFEDLKEWIGTLSEDEYDEMVSSASSFDSDFCKKCQFFCLELQLKYLQFCMKSYESFSTKKKFQDSIYHNITCEYSYEKQHGEIFHDGKM
jgi:hypothetical protein